MLHHPFLFHDRPVPRTLLFHFGALGDTVLLWPILRALTAYGEVGYVTQHGKARLAEACLPHVTAFDGEHPEFSRLYVPGAATEISDALHDYLGQVEYVISTFGKARDAWSENLWALANQAHHYHVQFKPVREKQVHVLQHVLDQLRYEGMPLNLTDAQLNGTHERINTLNLKHAFIHPGSGGRKKCWPLNHWQSWIERLQTRGFKITVILGEVELEQWSKDTLSHWHEQYTVESPDHFQALAELLNRGGVFMGHDSGVSHLAAQLGLPTFCLFGPTDPQVWGPVGRSVYSLGPAVPSPMSWLDIDKCMDHFVSWHTGL